MEAQKGCERVRVLLLRYYTVLKRQCETLMIRTGRRKSLCRLFACGAMNATRVFVDETRLIRAELPVGDVADGSGFWPAADLEVICSSSRSFQAANALFVPPHRVAVADCRLVSCAGTYSRRWQRATLRPVSVICFTAHDLGTCTDRRPSWCSSPVSCSCSCSPTRYHVAKLHVNAQRANQPAQSSVALCS
jgi:hypothetical protein